MVRPAGADRHAGRHPANDQSPIATSRARDLTPVVLVIKSPIALIAGIDAPVKSFEAMVDYAKANPGKLSVGQAGVGSMGHGGMSALSPFYPGEFNRSVQHQLQFIGRGFEGQGLSRALIEPQSNGIEV